MNALKTVCLTFFLGVIVLFWMTMENYQVINDNDNNSNNDKNANSRYRLFATLFLEFGIYFLALVLIITCIYIHINSGSAMYLVYGGC